MKKICRAKRNVPAVEEQTEEIHITGDILINNVCNSISPHRLSLKNCRSLISFEVDIGACKTLRSLQGFRKQFNFHSSV